MKAAEEADLSQLVNSLQMNMNKMSTKMTTFEAKVESMENEIKVRVDLKTLKLQSKNILWNLKSCKILKSGNNSYPAFEK